MAKYKQGRRFIKLRTPELYGVAILLIKHYWIKQNRHVYECESVLIPCLGGASIGAGAAAVGADVLNLGCQLVSDFSESARPRSGSVA